MLGTAEAKLAVSWKAHARRLLLGNGERVGGLVTGKLSVLQVEEMLGMAKGPCRGGKPA